MSTKNLPQATDAGHHEGSQQRKRVAVVGGGVSGLSAAWALNEHSDHEVVVFESNDYIGGHTNTVTYEKDGKTTPVDSGFIVANTATYPNLLAFFKLKGIELNESEMSFSASRDAGAFEWSGSGVGAAFAQTSNILKQDIYVMLYDVFRFNQYSTDILDKTVGKADRELSIGQYLEKYGYSQSFTDNYLIPMTSCIWSTSPDKVSLDFPALTLIRFLYNHHLLQTVNRPPWLTVKNGAVTYIRSITDKMPLGSVRPNCAVREVYRANNKVYVKFNDQQEEFDHIIFACHADTTLEILGTQATAEEQRILSNFKFNKNRAILHSDLSLMPTRRAAWTSWNFMTKSSPESSNIDSVCLTYWMNNLQHISEEDFGPVLVTLNPLHRPKEETIQGEWDYSHPAFTPAAVAAQNELHVIQNQNSTSFAGAWTKYGFHEDGFSSGLSVAMQHLDAKIPFEFVDATFMRGEKREVTLIDRVARVIFWGSETLFGIGSRVLGFSTKPKSA
ncbi:Putative uncharacterized protein [Taphrina deformans PYCC 5710]|uniref:Amine oxidase domain-containing protein n=1 Tax=Taphrina deformans (strain PYCC 5710 / ATCC 11124 / CBS 356.35 / IMI 108563 / JCM 9778 / NBRC 8474) TaxID=1097556 RepID=R4X6D8_TAPDE|nr:Putative uncharacterized protein [Taphrina deformans PYCC 5710]|eukprot:CCG80634.1 Putative uncharacterized protein [Taphrina deformans PYCC 5710]